MRQDARRFDLRTPRARPTFEHDIMRLNPRSKLVRTALLIVLAVSTATGFVGTALTPLLVTHHPMALLALDSAGRNLLLTRAVPLTPYLLIATVRRVSGALLFYLLGRWYGDSALHWLEQRAGRKGKIVLAVERAVRAAALPMVFIFPDALVSVLVGSAGLAPGAFVSVSLAGSVAVTLLIRSLGQAIAVPLTATLAYVAHHPWRITLPMVAVVTVTVFWKFVRPRICISASDWREGPDPIG